MSKSKVVLLDGGLGQEINRRASHAQSHPQWSVKVMQDEPELVTQVHREFIEAGAKVVILNNYTATPTRMKRYGMIDRYAQTHTLAIECMNNAIESAAVSRDDINIAGCLPPLAASYVAEIAPPYEQAYEEYCSLIEQQKDFVDVFLVETMSNLGEITAVLDALEHYGQGAYVSLTLKDDDSISLRSGQSLSDALALLCERKAKAALINCSQPEAIDKAIETLQGSSLTFGGFANGFKSVEPLKPGTTVDQLDFREDITPERYADHAISWVEKGASIVGGCCEISPQHIAHLNQRLQKAGYTVTKLV